MKINLELQTAFLVLVLAVFSSCSGMSLVLDGNASPDEPTSTDKISDNSTVELNGAPVEFSKSIYAASDLNTLCKNQSCEPPVERLPQNLRAFHNANVPEVCGFDYDSNQTSRFLIRKNSNVNGLRLWLSREDLFFVAWASLQHNINPHFLLGVMAQESFGNCAAVSAADAQGCFQITTYYGRLQLEASYPERVLDWHWTERGSYFPDTIFVDPITWFGSAPATDQFRLTLDPTAGRIFTVDVSSVANFPHGVIASALYFRWQQYFLYYNDSELRETIADLVLVDSEKSALKAAAYNGGVGRVRKALQDYGYDFRTGLRLETQNYVDRVDDFCVGFQFGTSYYEDKYTADDVDYLIDLLSWTYPADLPVDWDGLKAAVRANFFVGGVSEISFIDDVKALVYFVATFDPLLAPIYPDDVGT